MVVDAKRFGKNLERILKEKKMTQTRLAIEADMMPHMISRYVTGASSPTAAKLAVIGYVLDVSLDDLMEGVVYEQGM